MGPEVSPAFQRRSRCILQVILGVRLAETESRHVDSKEMRVFWDPGGRGFVRLMWCAKKAWHSQCAEEKDSLVAVWVPDHCALPSVCSSYRVFG
eukprot:gene8960-biopygen13717